MPIDLTALIDPHAQLPKYQQLAARFRDAIDAGALAPGEELPSEKQLRDATGMSREQIRRGFDLLVNEGLVVRRHGAATRVLEAPKRRRMEAARYIEELRMLRKGGQHPQVSAFTVDHEIEWSDYTVDVTVTREKATAEDARRLLVAEGADILRRVFTKYVKGEPVQLQRSAIPWEIGGGTPLADPGQQPWPGGTIAELHSLGLVATWVDETVETRHPRDDERRSLRMETQSSVFSIVRVFLVGDRPVEASRVIVDGSKYALHYGVDLTQD